MPEPTQNTGIIEGYRTSDYAGGTLPYEVLNPEGNWESYAPPGEWQLIDALDVMGCVSFSALNILEMLYFFHTGTRRNFSDRFTARMSGTTPDGNWLWKVGDSIRKDGLVDEPLWPAPAMDLIPQNQKWETYYSIPPMEVINKAKDFLKVWEVKYEFVDVTKESLMYHLKQSPLQVVFPNHAVTLIYSTQQLDRYFDSYAPFIKERTSPFTSALKYVLRKKPMVRLVKLDADKNIWLVHEGKRWLVQNVGAFQVIGGNIDSVEKLTNEQFNAIPDSGKTLAEIVQE